MAEERSVEAFDAAHLMVQEFRLIFAYNHDGTDDEADERQAAQCERFSAAREEFQRLLPKVRVVADDEVVELLEQIDRDVIEYWMTSTPGRSLVAEFGPAIDRAEDDLDRLEALLRTTVRGERMHRGRGVEGTA